ncbi:MAG: hypothetical protein KJ967_00185, partial [Elusimicrobia bacterium]|nr:hypothetical protein [Elusimicrobiota bacterium]
DSFHNLDIPVKKSYNLFKLADISINHERISLDFSLKLCYTIIAESCFLTRGEKNAHFNKESSPSSSQ